jgi:hypothetical protein
MGKIEIRPLLKPERERRFYIRFGFRGNGTVVHLHDLPRQA